MNSAGSLRNIHTGKNVVYTGPVFNRPFATIINSHQSLYPESAHSWVRSTIRAVESAASFNAILIGSTGLSSYDLVLWRAGRIGADQIVVMPVAGRDRMDKIIAECLFNFNLDERKTAFLCFISNESPAKSPERDRMVMAAADLVYPVSVRRTGRMRALLSDLPESGIDRTFEIPFETVKRRPVNCRVDHPDALELDGGYLTHWTRRSKGPFPGEKPADYYQSILSMNEMYGGSAFHALQRILTTERIYSSSNNIRGKHAIVSFTSLPPHQMAELMIWERGRVRYAFEPFGVAVKTSAMKKIGARPVIYGDKALYNRLKEADQPFYQYHGKDGKWRREREWRFAGDFHLRNIPVDDIRILAHSKPYADLLQNGGFGRYKIICLQK